MDVLFNIDVADLECAQAFYTQAFGWRLGRRLGPDVLELLGAQAPVYLLQKAPGTEAVLGTGQRRDYARHWTPVHLDMVVPDADAAVQRAVAAGAVLEQAAQTHDWGRIATLADPFGNGFCLLQFLGQGYDTPTAG